MLHWNRWVGIAALCLAGCQSQARSPVDATAPLPLNAPPLASDQWLLGQSQLSVDLESLSATLTPVAREAATQPPQNLQYDLDPRAVGIAPTIKILQVALDASGDLVVTWEHTHPLPPPDFSQPPSATNRADLGYTGRLLILADRLHESFFEDEAVLDPALVKDADGYTAVGQLLDDEPPVNTVFPYMLLVDEAKDNRVDRTNNGLPQGNYDPAQVGWQRDTSATPADWTGYDYLHAGQTVRNTLTLRREALAQSEAPIGLALLVKYTDPRGTADRAHRMPPDPPDHTQFAYRLPYAALDCSVVDLPEVVHFISSDTAGHELPFAIRDWDRAATEAPGYELDTVADVSAVQKDAANPPVVSFDAGSRADVLELLVGKNTGLGIPGDEVRFATTIRLIDDSAPLGESWVAVRVVDAEAPDPNGPQYRFGIDPITGLRSASYPLPRTTWQVMRVWIHAELQIDISPTGELGWPGDVVTFQAEVVPPATSFFWTFSHGIFPPSSSDPAPQVTLTERGEGDGQLIVVIEGVEYVQPFTYSIAQTARRIQIPIPATQRASDRAPGLAIVGGLPVVAVSLSEPVQIHIAYASTAAPQSSEDWTMYQILNGDIPTGKYNGGLALIDDRLTLPVRAGGSLLYAFSATTAPTIPHEVIEWRFVTFPAEETLAGLEVVEFDGRLAAAGWRPGTPDELRVGICNAIRPAVPSDWTFHTAVTANDASDAMALAVAGTLGAPRLAVASIRSEPDPEIQDLEEMYLDAGIATEGVPTSSGDWAFHTVFNAPGIPMGLMSNPVLKATRGAGDPAGLHVGYLVIWSDLGLPFNYYFRDSTTPLPTDADDWQARLGTEIFTSPSLEIVNDVATIGRFVSPGRYFVSTSTDDESWQTQTGEWYSTLRRVDPELWGVAIARRRDAGAPESLEYLALRR